MSRYNGYGCGRQIRTFHKEYKKTAIVSMQLDMLRDGAHFRWISNVEKPKRAPRVTYTLWALSGTPRVVHKIFLSKKGVITGHYDENGQPCTDNSCPFLLSCYEYIFLREQKTAKDTLTGWRVLGLGQCINVYKPQQDKVYIKFKPLNCLTGNGHWHVEDIYDFKYLGMEFKEFLKFVKKLPTIRQYENLKEKGYKSKWHLFEETLIENPEFLKNMSRISASKHFGLFKDSLFKYIRIFEEMHPDIKIR